MTPAELEYLRQLGEKMDRILSLLGAAHKTTDRSPALEILATQGIDGLKNHTRLNRRTKRLTTNIFPPCRDGGHISGAKP